MLPSKELMSAVLGKNIEEIRISKLNYKNFLYNATKVDSGMISIYEFMYLCKEWAFQQRYNVYSLGKWRDSYRDTYLSYSVTIKTFEENIDYAMNKCYNDKFYADTEPEAVFKACEWILENK